MDAPETSNDSSFDSTLDTKTYPSDYVSDMFNKINWGARVKNPRSVKHWLDPGTWDEYSYTRKYLEYKIEEGQVDLTNPFHIEESNKLRSRLVKKSKRGGKEVTELNMMTEGLRDVDDETKQDDEIDEDDDGNYLDEYGNLRESKQESKTIKSKPEHKGEKKANLPPNSHKSNLFPKNLATWKDLDDLKSDDKQSNKPSSFVKSAIQVPEASSQLIFPRDSSLSWTEQEKFLYNDQLVKEGKLTPSNGNQWIFYQNFLELVQEEQQEFADFIKANFNSFQSKICPDHAKYVTEHRAARISRVLEQPRFWNKLKQVRMISANDEHSCAMILEQTLLELGKIPQANIYNRFQPRSNFLTTDYFKLANKFPTNLGLMPGTLINNLMSDSGDNTGDKIDHSKYLHKKSCIDDPNCRIIAQHLVPDVIISASGLKCLMDNHKPHLGRKWELPFIIRTFKSEVDSRTVVIFGKPLLSNEVTVTECKNLAHKIAIKVDMFKQDWEVKIVEDIFDAELCLDKLEVFGTVSNDIEISEALNNTYNSGKKKNRTKKKKRGKKNKGVMEIDDEIAQLDGADSGSDSDDNLVISEESNQVDQTPPRRSTRLRNTEVPNFADMSKGKTSVRSTKKVISNLAATSSSILPPHLDDDLDFEPDDEPKSDLSTTDTNCDDPKTGEIQNIGKTENEDQIANVNTSMEREETDSSSSSEDDEAGQLLLQKKLLLSKEAAAKNNDPDLEKSSPNKNDTSSSSDDEDGQLLLQKKMLMMKSAQQSPAVPDTAIEAHAHPLSEESDNEPLASSSPKKKLKIVSSESEEDERTKDKEDHVAKKLKELGRENANVDELKKKINITKNLKKLSNRKQKHEKSLEQAAERDARALNKDKIKNNDDDSGDITIESPKSSISGNNKSSIRNKADLDDSDSDSDGRFNKFSSVKEKEGGYTSILDNLLSRQDKLHQHHASQKLKSPAHVKIENPAMTSIAQGLPSIEKFLPPINGNNVTYRIWKLYDKAMPSKVFRCVVRSKVAGVTKEGVVVTPSVKLEHQPQFGAEQVTPSQVSKEWISTLIRPNSRLARVRVHPDSRVAMIEEKSFPQLTQECRNLGVDPSKNLANVYNVLRELTQLQAGQYILQHSGNTGAFCSVLEARANSSPDSVQPGQWDLHQIYKTLQPEHMLQHRVPYCPIDTNIVTPWHRENGRIPGTFQPSGVKSTEEEVPFRGGRDRGRGRGGYRGGGGFKGRGRKRGNSAKGK